MLPADNCFADFCVAFIVLIFCLLIILLIVLLIYIFPNGMDIKKYGISWIQIRFECLDGFSIDQLSAFFELYTLSNIVSTDFDNIIPNKSKTKIRKMIVCG